jgi:curved DNA-binding protein CbpA
MKMGQQTLDPYAVLGLDPDASDDQVVRAHHRLAKRYHPDVNPGVGATDRMRRINQARQVLSSAERRAGHDRANGRAAAPGRARGTAVWRGEWPPSSPGVSWAGSDGVGSHSDEPWSTEPWPTYGSAGRWVSRSRYQGRGQGSDDFYGSLGCVLLLVAALLLFLLVRIPLSLY